MLKKVDFETPFVIIFGFNSREMEFDGIVLESWSRWAAYGVLHDPDMRKMVLCPVVLLQSVNLCVTSIKPHGHKSLNLCGVGVFNLLGTAIRKTTWRYTSLHELTEK